MNRRDLLKCLAAGGAVVAGELWVPGRKLISIPSGQVFAGRIELLELWSRKDSRHWSDSWTYALIGPGDRLIRSVENAVMPFAFEDGPNTYTISISQPKSVTMQELDRLRAPLN